MFTINGSRREFDEWWSRRMQKANDYDRLEAENATLKRELRTERRTTLGALLDSGAISLVQWEEGMEQLALLTAEESE